MNRRFLVLLALLLAIGCRREAPAARASAQATPAAQQPQDGGTLVRRLASDVNTLNMLHIGSDPERQILALVHDPLIAIDAQLRFVPGLAEKWEISPDGKVYTFFIDKRANFSDGTPVKASDVIFTLRKIVDPKSESQQFAGLFEAIDLQQTVPIDERTARIVFREARPSQMATFNIGILPEHVYGKGDILRDFIDIAVGSGPYTLQKRDAGKEIVLVRRANYWQQSPHIERVIFKILPDDVAWNALKTGAIDETRMTSDQWAMERDRPEIRDSIDIRQFYQLGYNFIAWNMKHPALSDLRVRRALSMSLDRGAIINGVYYGTARVITGPFTPDQWAYNPDVPAIEYDPGQASSLLAQAGWRDTDRDGTLDRGGKPLAIELLITNPTTKLQGQMYQAALKAIGVNLRLQQVDGATLFERVYDGKFDGAFLAWGLDLDPDPFAYFHSSQFPPAGQNISYYANPAADRLMEQGRRELDQDKRRVIYHQLHAVLANDQPYTWTVQPTSKWAVSRRLQGVKAINGLGLYLWQPGPFAWWIPREQRVHDRPTGTASP
jgi:peptide/nickel transport system substrate-binding protein